MKKTEIPEAARDLNVSWIESVEKTLDELGNPTLVSQIMKAAGQKCAEAILADCEEILSKKPETVYEPLGANNRRRLQKLNHRKPSLWRFSVVEPAVTRQPPHRPGRERLTHPVPQ